MRRLVLVLLFVAALPILAMAEEHVVLEATFKNMDAESLTALLAPLTIKAQMAVVDDGNARIYFRAEREEVARILAASKGELPEHLLIGGLEQVQGAIPVEPKQAECMRPQMTVDAEKARVLGISSSQIASYLQGLREAIASEKGIEQGTMTTSDGRKVPARSLVTVTMVKVKRPIIIKQAPDKQVVPSIGDQPSN